MKRPEDLLRITALQLYRSSHHLDHLARPYILGIICPPYQYVWAVYVISHKFRMRNVEATDEAAAKGVWRDFI
jgi:hypothetical protein